MPDTFYGYEDWARERGLLPELPAPDLPRLPELAPYLVDEPPPDLQEPELLPTEPMSGWQRMAMVLSQFPEYQRRPYESGGTALGRGLLSGLARGFGGAGVAGMQRHEEMRGAENERRSRAAERANALALESWKYRRGTVPREVGGKPVRVPVGAVYAKETPQATVAKPEPSLKRIEAEAQARARGTRRGAPPEARGERTPQQIAKDDQAIKAALTFRLRAARDVDAAEEVAVEYLRKYPFLANSGLFRTVVAETRRRLGF